jgi:uncharacterized protein (UPF0335 family)
MSDTPTAGHNSVAVDQLRAFVERVERLEEEKQALSEDIKEVYNEAKGTGFDVKTLRKIVAMRKMDREKLLADKAMLDLYADALGIFG